MNDTHKTREQLIEELALLRSEVKQLAQTRQELVELKDYLENVIESSLDCVVVTDNRGYISRVNGAFLNLLSYREEEVLGRMIASFAPLEEGTYESTTGEPVEIGRRFLDETAAVGSGFMRDGKVSNWESYLLTKNRQLVPVDINIAFLYKNGERIGAVGVLRDIRERREAEREIRKGRDSLANLIESSMDGIAIVDEKGYILSVNSALLKMSQFARERLVGQHISILTVDDKEVRKRLLKKTEELFEKGFASYESKHKVGEDQYIDVECNTSLVKDDKGNNVAGIAIIRDITERKKSEEALLASEAKYRSVVSNIGIGIALISPDMEILSLNNQMQQWFPDADVSKKPICYKTFNTPPRQNICSYCPTCKTLRDGQIHESVSDTPRGDKTIHYRIISSPLKDKEGRITSAIEMVEDITERQRSEQRIVEYQNQLRSLTSQLITAEERNRQSLATFLHDQIGQVLCTLKIRLEMLRGAKSLGKDTRSVHEMLATVAQLIADTRSLTSELNPPILHELGLGPGLEWLAERMHEREGITVHFEDDKQPRTLNKAMNILLFSAVRELLINVAKHARAQHAKVSIGSDGAGVYVCVDDDGMGFDCSGDSLPVSHGNSFGLFSIKERLRYVGGHLDIQSQPGQGTRVTLHIPHDISKVSETADCEKGVDRQRTDTF